MNTHETIQFLEQQSRMCVSRATDPDAARDTRIKYSILADLYLTLASSVSILTVGHTANMNRGQGLPNLEAADDVLHD